MKSKLYRIICVAVILTCPACGDVVFELKHEFSGAAEPSGTPPWLRATFSDAALGTVDLILENLLQDADEFLGKQGWYFNLNPALDAQDLVFTYIPGTDQQAADQIQKGMDAFKADGDGYFDILMTWPSSELDRFVGGESAMYRITGIPTLTANDFSYVSVNGPIEKNGLFSAAHIQAIGSNDSGWIASDPTPVPEPGTWTLLVGLLAGLAFLRRK